MSRNFGLFAAVLTASVFMAYACTEGEVVQGGLDAPGAAGNQGTAGQNPVGLGGTTGAAGTVGSGGSVQPRGGTTGTAGNTPPRGGTTGTAGNTPPRGGTTGTGGMGSTGVAGSTGAGATVGTAGTTGTGGSGSGVICPANFEVNPDGFTRAPAMGNGGCFHGYAFAGGDTGSSITPMNFSACTAPCMLRIMGTVGPAVAPSYAGVAYVGFNVGQENGGTTTPLVAPTGTGLTITYTASTGSLPLRLQVSAGSTFWCYTITGASPVNIPYAMLNTACWDNTGTYYMKQPIQNIQLVVPGGATATTGVSVTLAGVKEY